MGVVENSAMIGARFREGDIRYLPWSSLVLWMWLRMRNIGPLCACSENLLFESFIHCILMQAAFCITCSALVSSKTTCNQKLFVYLFVVVLIAMVYSFFLFS